MSIVLDGEEEEEENDDDISDDEGDGEDGDDEILVEESTREMQVSNIIWNRQDGKVVVGGTKKFKGIYASKSVEAKKWKDDYQKEVRAGTKQMMHDYEIEQHFMEKKVK